MRDTSITSQEVDILFEQRGEVDCDGKNSFDGQSWKEQQRYATRSAMDRRAYLDSKQQQAKEELL